MKSELKSATANIKYDHLCLFSFSRSYFSLVSVQMLQILMARVLILWLSRSFILRTKSGMIRQIIAQARIYYPNWQISRLGATIRSSFSHSYSFSLYRHPRMLCMQVQALLSMAISKSSEPRMTPSKATTSSCVMTRLHLLVMEVILGGQISFILLARRSRVRAIFSQFYSVMKKDFRLRRLRQEIARYCVSRVTFLLQERIHLIAYFLYSSSMESMELVELLEEWLVSAKLGSDVLFCSSLAEAIWLLSWKFSCMFYYFVNSNKEDISFRIIQCLSHSYHQILFPIFYH